MILTKKIESTRNSENKSIRLFLANKPIAEIKWNTKNFNSSTKQQEKYKHTKKNKGKK